MVPSIILERREVSEEAILIVLNHSRGGVVVVVGGPSRQDDRTACVDRAGLTIINMLKLKIHILVS